jgi:hypothetical protein
LEATRLFFKIPADPWRQGLLKATPEAHLTDLERQGRAPTLNAS